MELAREHLETLLLLRAYGVGWHVAISNSRLAAPARDLPWLIKEGFIEFHPRKRNKSSTIALTPLGADVVSEQSPVDLVNICIAKKWHTLLGKLMSELPFKEFPELLAHVDPDVRSCAIRWYDRLKETREYGEEEKKEETQGR